MNRLVTVLCLLPACCLVLDAQEVRYIDLTRIEQHAQLRHPPPPPVDCEQGKPCVGGGFASVGVADGGPNPRDPHALGVYLERVRPTEINPAEPFEAEFRIVNTGLAPIEIPISPHLTELQPADESADFEYLSLALVIEVRGLPKEPEMVSYGSVELYGSADRDETLLTLKPGEWIRVTANVKLHSWPQGSGRFRGQFWLRRNAVHPHPGGESREIYNLYPNPTPTPWIVVRLTHPSRPEEPKQ